MIKTKWKLFSDIKGETRPNLVLHVVGSSNRVRVVEKGEHKKTESKKGGEPQKPPNRELLPLQMHENSSHEAGLEGGHQHTHDDVVRARTKVDVGERDSDPCQNQESRTDLKVSAHMRGNMLSIVRFIVPFGRVCGMIGWRMTHNKRNN